MRLKELREEKGLTQAEVAKAIGTSQRNVGRWENQENEPTTSSIIALANYFECTTDYLTGRSDDFGAVSIKKTPPTLTQEEEKLLNEFRTLQRGERAQILEYVEYVAQRRGNKNKNA